MLDERVCPACESRNIEYVDSREDCNYRYVDMHCKDCGCEYTCQLVEVIHKIKIKIKREDD